VPDAQPLTVLYDGRCGLCHASVAWATRHAPPGTFRFEPREGPVGSAILARSGVDPAVAAADSMVVVDGDRLLIRSDATLAVARRLRLPWRLLSLGTLVPRGLRDAIYASLAARRHRWPLAEDRCEIATAPATPTPRYHGLDVLRAAMMLLGVLLHAACNYIPGPADGGWPAREPDSSPLAGVLVVFIHAFRMPAFFLLAGFFGAMMLERRGMPGMAFDRLRRIGLPLVVGWVILFPLVKGAFILAAVRDHAPSLQASIIAFPREMLASPWADPSPAHLWFLWYLLLLYAAAGAVVVLLRTLPSSWRRRLDDLAGRSLSGSFRLPLLGLVGTLALFPMKGPMLDTPGAFAPDLKVLAAYALPFGVGWLLWRRRDVIDDLKSLATRRRTLVVGSLLAATLACIAASLIGFGRPGSDAVGLVTRAVVAISVWWIILGGIGMAESISTAPGRLTRRLVDASYWIYLAHLPLCVVVPLALRDWEVAPMVKVLVTTVLTTGLLLVSFEAMRAVLPPRRGSTR
jgi:predicted DCC family thiol-disulfide oxidoreductase YuxK/peptidoglycan/LPS O-acetylase OafA/YrhL